MLDAPLHEFIRELNDSVMKSGREKAVDLILSRDNPQRAVEQGLISGREALEWLVRGDREGKYVFHGTPAVAAIASPDVPIFMAIISSGRDRMAGRQHHSSWGGEGNTFNFKS